MVLPKHKCINIYHGSDGYDTGTIIFSFLSVIGMTGKELNMLNFRRLFASEIDARAAQVNQWGVSVLLYKDARVDMTILDETVGPMNWQKSYSRDNANCTVSIWDESKKQWISKEDTGTESNTEKEKGLASDSFKRACFNWGIGRELYSSPRIFFWAKELHGFSDQNGRYRCTDRFTVRDIDYTEQGLIKSVTVDVSDNKGVYLTKTFVSEKAERAANDTVRTAAPTESEPKPVPAPKKSNGRITAPIKDDEVILVGDCKGKTFGEVKNTKPFLEYLKSCMNSTAGFDTEEEQKQFLVFKSLGEQLYGKKSA